ncbi:MAG TPA: trehalose-phosphatase, partial [bacterium]
MRTLKQDVDPHQFFAELSRAPKRLLILDYDGTLAPFRVERDQAVPYPGVRQALSDLQTRAATRVVLVSGRGAENLVPLLGVEPVPEIWGSHGWERRMPDGRLTVQQPNANAQEGLRLARAIVEGNAPERWEVKPVSLAAHWRGAEPAEAARVRVRVEALWPKLAETHGLEVHAFDGGIELRVPGVNKGTAVAALLAESGDGVKAAYQGDDRTDEDAFAA